MRDSETWRAVQLPDETAHGPDWSYDAVVVFPDHRFLIFASSSMGWMGVVSGDGTHAPGPLTPFTGPNTIQARLAVSSAEGRALIAGGDPYWGMDQDWWYLFDGGSLQASGSYTEVVSLWLQGSAGWIVQSSMIDDWTGMGTSVWQIDGVSSSWLSIPDGLICSDVIAACGSGPESLWLYVRDHPFAGCEGTGNEEYMHWTYDQGMWLTAAFDLPVTGLRDLWCGPDGQAYGIVVEGDQSHLLHYDGTGWSVVPGTESTERTWTRVDLAADGALWLVADDFAELPAVYEVREGIVTEHPVEGVSEPDPTIELYVTDIAVE